VVAESSSGPHGTAPAEAAETVHHPRCQHPPGYWLTRFQICAFWAGSMMAFLTWVNKVPFVAAAASAGAAELRIAEAWIAHGRIGSARSFLLASSDRVLRGRHPRRVLSLWCSRLATR